MILPELDPKTVAWDSWKAFHWQFDHGGVSNGGQYGNWPITVFDTNEVVFTYPMPDPNLRGRYNQFGFSVLGTTDTALPTLYLPDEDDQEPVPRAWLTENGMQYLLIDEATRRAVALGDLDNNQLVPQRLRKRAKAYFAGPGSPPIGAPVRVSRPLARVFDKDELEKLDSLKAACDMQFAMTTPPKWDRAADPHNRYSPPSEGVDLRRLLAVNSVLELTNNEQVLLHLRGLTRARQNYDHLLAL